MLRSAACTTKSNRSIVSCVRHHLLSKMVLIDIKIWFTRITDHLVVNIAQWNLKPSPIWTNISSLFISKNTLVLHQRPSRQACLHVDARRGARTSISFQFLLLLELIFIGNDKKTYICTKKLDLNRWILSKYLSKLAIAKLCLSIFMLKFRKRFDIALVL